ncbi:hypothetical protein Tco_0776977 [Tanacetum coccineum]
MSIEKSWTRPTLNLNYAEFKLGLNDFYERCKAHINDRGLCCCPCRLCGNRDKLTPINIKHHIHNNGFSMGYPTWVHHGEPRIIPSLIVDDTNDIINVLNDVRRENNYIEPEPNTHTHTHTHTEHNTEHNINTASISNAPPEAAGPTKYDMEGLFEMANEELFPACNWMSSLDFLAKFAHLKDNKDEEICPTCKGSRWKNKDTAGKKVLNKVLCYFPLIPRLKQFAKEDRNVQLGLAADGFNPFGNLSQSYSTWPVILTTYNTPPWICMKESSFMLTVLIPGPKSPGKDMDVYLQPLVKELKTLWKKLGVKTLDVAINTEFSIRAMLLWTINNFPARSSLSGWSGQGYLACPTCNEETPSTRVNGKTAYVGHRRFLPIKHRWRNDKTFNVADVPSHIPSKHLSYGGVKRQRDPIVEKNWSKRSIFYELSYWSSLPLKQNLDAMQIEKIKKGNRKFIKPHPMYSFPSKKRQKFYEFIKGVKLPDGFGSNFKPKVTDNDNNLIGMKSYDCHLMMQWLLPAGAQAYLDSSIATPIIELYSFFKQIYARSIKGSDMLIAEDQLVHILCNFEQIYPPLFFDIMIHLVMHLPVEAIIARPEGCIAEAYIAEEALTFCSHYLRNVPTRFNRPDKNDDGPPPTSELEVF